MKMQSGMLSVVCVLLVCVVWAEAQNRPQDSFHNPRGCGEAGFCCSGQNNTCAVRGPRLDNNNNETYCYCDSNCLVMHDCCLDYQETCTSQDCEVSGWSEWQGCDNPCGLGSRKRIRKVAIFPENGGKSCPVLKERRACTGDGSSDDCLQQSVEYHKEELQERGEILPRKYGFHRDAKEYNPWKGILKNLYEKNFNEIFKQTTYRAKFVVTESREACKQPDTNGEPWAAGLAENAVVCVECQPTAMDRELGTRCRGHGVWDQVTRWNAVGIHGCHGKWMLIEKHESAVCDKDGDINLIFV